MNKRIAKKHFYKWRNGGKYPTKRQLAERRRIENKLAIMIVSLSAEERKNFFELCAANGIDLM